jgi:IstB-like ATP binding protein
VTVDSGTGGTGAELLFEVFSQRYERSSTLVTSNLPFNEWTEAFGSERLTGALLDRLNASRPHPRDERGKATGSRTANHGAPRSRAPSHQCGHHRNEQEVEVSRVWRGRRGLNPRPPT